MKIRGRYGKQHWQETFTPASLTLQQAVSKREPGFDKNGVRKIDTECTWLFQESKIYFELSKRLTCIRDRHTYFQYDQLNGKTVDFTIKANPIERPRASNKWIESEIRWETLSRNNYIKPQTSWKPCLGNEKSDLCQQPPQFKTFQMNGQTCTVYPGCTE